MMRPTARDHVFVPSWRMALATAVIALGATVDVSTQCAMCRTVLASPEGQQMVAALRSGILLLFVAPFIVFASVATLAVRLQRRRRAVEGTAHE